MPFLAAIPPAIGALIGGGVAAGGSLLASKMSSNANKSIATQQLDAAQAAQARSKPAFDTAYNYYNSILKGGPDLQAALSPSINAVNSNFTSAYKNTVNSAYGRGGALDKALRNLQTGRAMTLSDLYGQAQTGAVSGLAGLAGNDASQAAALLGQANTTQQQSQAAKSQALGGIGSILTRLLTTPGLFGSNSQTPQLADPNSEGRYGGQYGPPLPAAVYPDQANFSGAKSDPYDLRSWG